jgi:hypothetical protein
MYEMCDCGHFGGESPNSMHLDDLHHGHGACRECKCPQFNWVGFCDAYGKPLINDDVKAEERSTKEGSKEGRIG